jgi:phosphoribosylformylglycinamidine synthase
LQSPNIASKEWIYGQYDHSVQTNTVVYPGQGDAAVLRIREASGNKGIAVKADCNSRYCYLDPFEGARIAIAECARNLVCVGAEPGGVTDCLCFGNPEKPDRFWQFKRGVEGIADACKYFHLPVVSGNVSLYNETPESVIHPSPLIGMVGVIEDVERAARMAFHDAGDVVVLVGDTRDELGGSEYLATVHGLEEGRPPYLDLEREVAVQKLVLAAIREGLVKSAHDCADGGLVVALAESCIAGQTGAHIEIEEGVAQNNNIRVDSLLWGESQSRIVVSVAPENLEKLHAAGRALGVPVTKLGIVGGDSLNIADNRLNQFDQWIALPVVEMENAWRGAIGRIMGK